MKNSWKRVAAGALALAIVASNVTANVGTGGLLASSTITASAATLANDGVSITVVDSPLTYNGSDQQLILAINGIDNPDYWENHSLWIRFDKDGETGTWRHGGEVISGFAYADAGTYEIYAASVDGSSRPDDNAGELVGTVTIAKANYTEVNSPTIETELKYNGSAQKLLSEKGSAKLSYEQAATEDYMEFALPAAGKTVVTEKVTSDNLDITFDAIEEGTVYSPTGDGGFYFYGCDIKLDGTNTTFTPGDNYINFFKLNDDFRIHHSGGYFTLDSGYDALYVTNKDTDNNTITVKPVKLADYVTADELTWNDDIPEGTDAGTYTVYYRAKGNDNVNASAADSVEATIAKATATVAPADLTYDGTEKELFTIPVNSDEEIEFAEDKDYAVISETNLELTIGQINSSQVFTPTGFTGISFPLDYPILLGQKEYFNPIGSVVLNKNDDKFYIVDDEGSHELPDGTNALLIKEITDTAIVVEAVNTADFDGDKYWSTTMPTGTDAGTYTYLWRITGTKSKNYELQEAAEVTATIAKATLVEGEELTEGVDYTAPTVKTETGLDYLFYNNDDRDLITAGSVRADIDPENAADEDKVKMEYGILGSKEGVSVLYQYDNSNPSYNLSVSDIVVNKIYTTNNSIGINLPSYYDLIIDGDTYSYSSNSERRCNFYLSDTYGDYRIIYGNNKTYRLPDGCDGIMVTDINTNHNTITIEPVNVAEATTEWSADVSTAKEIGEYNVYYRIQGGANYENVAPTKIGTAKIDYKKIPYQLSNLDTDTKPAVITEVNGDNETAVTGETLAASKTYYIYTDKTIAESVVDEYELTRLPNKSYGDVSYKYRYTLTIPATSEVESYDLYHQHATSVHSNTAGDGVYVECAGENDSKTDIAWFDTDETYYYGSYPEKTDIKTKDALGASAEVVDFYFTATDSTTSLTKDKLKFGETYYVNARVAVTLEGKDTPDYLSIKRTVKFERRPMNLNDYYLATDIDDEGNLKDGATKLAVEPVYSAYEDDGTTPKADATITGYDVIVPEGTFTYNGTEQKPTIIVKNGGNNADVVASIPATDTADAVAKDYIDGVNAETDAGDYSYTLTAETGTTEAPANYTGAITVKWSIAQADIQQYISVAPKNNVDTDEDEKNDAIVYDGAVLDSKDFEVTKSEAYDNADDATKALVNEFIAQLTATPATETTPAVAAKTTVDVAPAKVEKTTETEYEASDYTGANGVTLDESNYTSFIDKIVNGNITVTAIDAQNGYMNFHIGENAEYSTIITGKSNINAESYNLVFSNNSLECNVNGPFGVKANDGYLLAIEDIEIKDYSKLQLGKGYDITFKGVPAKETTTSLADSDIKDANKDGEVKKANVTVKNSNFKDVEFKQTLTNDGKIDTTVEDKSIPVTIAKREVTLTPDAEQKMTYRDTDMPDLTYTIEDAKADGLTGVVAADKALFQKTTGEGSDAVTTNTGAIYVDKLVQEDAQADPVQFVYATDENNDIDYTTAGLNNAGSYTYAVSEDDKFANYELTIAENAPKFTVKPLDLSAIVWSIALRGLSTGWDQNQPVTYTYDGTTKEVEVVSVRNAPEGVQTATFNINGTSEPENNKIVNNGVTVTYTAADKGGNPATLLIVLTVDANNDVTITIPDGAVASEITLSGTYGDPFEDGDDFVNKTFTNLTGDVSVYSLLTGEFDGVTEFTVTNVTVKYEYADAYVLTADTDYTVGGMTKSATVGEKNVQIKGTGNYTGVAKATWKINSAEVAPDQVKFKINDGATWTVLPQDVQYYSCYYTGKPISCDAEFTDPDSDYAQEAEVTVKYTRFNNITGDYEEVDEAVHQGKYKVNVKVECDGYSPVEFNYDINIAPKEIYLVDTSFTINYGEDYSDHTDELLALFVENGLLQSDADLIKQMLEDGTLIWYYDYDEDYDEGDLYPTWSEDVLEAAAEEAVNEGKNPEDWTVIESMIHKLYGDAVFQVANQHDNDIALANPIIKPKSIKSDDVTVEFTNGNTVVLAEDGFVEESNIIVKDTGILNDDGEPTVLLADKDYELNIESTATEGEFTVEIVGKGNYKGVRIEKFKAITAIQNATKISITDPVPTVNASGVGRVSVTITREVDEGFTNEETGIIYVKDASSTEELTLENVGNNGVLKATATNTNGSKTYHITDPDGKGSRSVGYIVVSKDGKKETLYTNEIKATYAELVAQKAIDEATTLTISEPAPTVNASGVGRVSVTIDRQVDTGFTITETGIIYVKDASSTEELTLGNVGNNGVLKATATNTNGSKTYHITDPDGKGSRSVGYITVTDGTYSKTIYTNEVKATYAELTALKAIDEATTITITDPVATVNASGVGRVSVTIDREVEDGFTITETGIIYVKDASSTEELTLGNVGNNGVLKATATNTNGSKTYHITDPDGKGSRSIGYIVVTDGTYSKTIYTNEVSGKYSELMA